MHYIHSLGTFFPSLKSLLGDLIESHEEVSSYIQLLKHLIFLPEILNWKLWQIPPHRSGYPLRPELIESVWYLDRSCGSEGCGGLEFAVHFIDTLEKWYLRMNRYLCLSFFFNFFLLFYNDLLSFFFVFFCCIRSRVPCGFANIKDVLEKTKEDKVSFISIPHYLRIIDRKVYMYSTNLLQRNFFFCPLFLCVLDGIFFSF